MSFLAPLFALGALAVALPVVFHLIQRRPRGEQFFSSLMFLSPTAPRISRRSRLNHLLLLALRASAIVLLALAFARPFLRALQQLTVSAPARQVVLLVDRSASMQRAGVWESALEHAAEVLKSVEPTDEVALFTFDDRVRKEIGFSDAPAATASHVGQIRQVLSKLRPGWLGSNLGLALTTVADQVRPDTESAGSVETTLILLSDLQQGIDLSSLQEYRWPPDVGLEIRTLDIPPGNASLRILPDNDELLSPSQLRVRVSNAEDSAQSSFQLQWLLSENQATRDAKPVQVAAGRQRTIVLERPADAIALQLAGDSQPFDNTLHLAKLKPLQKSVWFWGDTTDQRQRQFFFLNRIDLSTPRVTVTLRGHNQSAAPDGISPDSVPLVICASQAAIANVSELKPYLQSGGRVLIVLDPSELGLANEEPGEGLAQNVSEAIARLCELNSVQIQPLTSSDAFQSDDFLLLGEIDFRNPLFAPFADPKYSDFTKIRFRHAFRIQADHEQAWSVVARFDNQASAIVEKSIGDGKLWIMTTGWHSDTSNLALSTKFVPLLSMMMGPDVATQVRDDGIVTGQTIRLQNREPYTHVVRPDGVQDELDKDSLAYAKTDLPGLYRFVRQSAESDESADDAMAANVPPDESLVTPLDHAELERRGVRLGTLKSTAQQLDEQRQMRDVELESRQKLWRWILAAALAVLAIETYVAGQSSRNESRSVA
jgi:hypothetical protein